MVIFVIIARATYNGSKISLTYFLAAKRFLIRGMCVSLSSQVGEPPLFGSPLCL